MRWGDLTFRAATIWVNIAGHELWKTLLTDAKDESSRDEAIQDWLSWIKFFEQIVESGYAEEEDERLALACSEQMTEISLLALTNNSSPGNPRVFGMLNSSSRLTVKQVLAVLWGLRSHSQSPEATSVKSSPYLRHHPQKLILILTVLDRIVIPPLPFLDPHRRWLWRRRNCTIRVPTDQWYCLHLIRLFQCHLVSAKLAPIVGCSTNSRNLVIRVSILKY